MLSHSRFVVRLTAKRATRGFSNATEDLTPLLPGLSPQQIDKIDATNRALRTRHIQLESDLPKDDRDIVRRKRVIYRSKQCGWLEADILLGSWAAEHVPKLSNADLDDYEKLLNEETVDIFNFVSGRDPMPDHLKDLPVIKQLRAWVTRTKITEPEAYAKVKKESNLI